MSNRIRQRLRLRRPGRVLGAGFLALSLFIAAAVIFSVQQQSNDAVVRHALQVEIALADVFSELQDAEIGQRGFLLTGQNSFLEPYRAAGAKIDNHLAVLGRLIASSEELVTFDRLRARIAEKRTELAETLTLVSGDRREQALAVVQGGRGKALMDDVRTLIAALDEREDRVVEQRQARVRVTGLLVVLSTMSAVILLGLVALAAMREVQRRSALARFLPAEIAERLAHGDRSLLEGRELPAAIAFVDIRGSTALAEQLDVSALTVLLNDFRGDVHAAAAEAGGLIDKFMGDGALVVFGIHDDGDRASAEALAFARALLARHRANHRPYGIGIGLHHGIVFCGIVGAAGRQEFTVLGDAVNVAARLEKETRSHGTDLLVSDAVLRHAAEPADLWRQVASDSLRGRQARISLYAERDATDRCGSIDVGEHSPTHAVDPASTIA